MKRERKKLPKTGNLIPTPKSASGKAQFGGRQGGIGPPQESTTDSGSTQAAAIGGYAEPAGRRGTARGMSSPTAARGTVGPLQGFSAKLEETAVPTYPLERERALERRWFRLLQRTVAPKKYLRQDRRASASPRRSPNSAFQPARTATATGGAPGCVRAFSASTTQSCSDPAKAINRLDRPLSARAWSRSHQG
jgi:hypothetical protein